ncbi:MAG TPA: CoA-disulfide reductase [Syntrophomonadaceae bacterium]|nr:CoA-disulfide reductase [Syntrophomonadaceae bacterium]
MQERLVIIGGVAAGMSAAAKARRTNPDLTIEVYTQDEYISYAGCGLPYFIGDKVTEKEQLFARSVEQFRAQNINVIIQTKVTNINPKDKTVTISHVISGEVKIVTYDKLVIATGARALVPPLEGLDLLGILPLRNVHDSLSIKEYFANMKPKKAVIIGGGYIGLEMVENLAEYECEIVLIEASSQILPNMDQNMAQIVTDYLTSKGITVRINEKVFGFAGDEHVQKVITEQGSIETDFVLLSTGVHPNSELASKAGIELGVANAIKVNKRMETSLTDIYAAGDCATTTHLVSGEEVYIPMGTTANKQGKTAGENIAGGSAEFNGVLGTGIAKVMDLEISRTGLNEKECQKLGIDFTAHTIKSKTTAHFCPAVQDIWIKIIADTNNRRILGGQIVGYKGAAKRIDVLATAITSQSTIEDLIDMDLAYSPPFGPVWDPVLVALNQF